MLFLGDRERAEDPRAALGEVAGALERAALAHGPERHGALVAALVRAGEVAQGLADAEGAARGADGDGPRTRAAMEAVVRIAGAVERSWRAGGRAPPPEDCAGALDRVLALPLPGRITVRRPEGFALYAVYPEAYADAARALAPAPDLTVIGIRSVGTGLAAMVAAGAEARSPPVTVRPVGHPFARTVRLAPDLARALRARAAGSFAIVDEGPGLSGSSFAAVAEALVGLGAEPARVHLFPAHGGDPGPRASAAVRARWRGLPRHVAGTEAILLGDGPLALARMAEDVLGPASGPPEDLGAGGWRARVAGTDPASWPASQGWLERRKYLLVAGGRRWLARFAGLGARGARALEHARALAEAGLWCAPATLRQGFLLEPWLDDARPVPRAAPAAAALRAAVLRRIEVAARRPAQDQGAGAAPADLLAMACANADEAHGPEAARVARRLESMLPELCRTARPCEVDGRMGPWEWLVQPSGRVLKADGLDHHAGHDLAGCQDALWDVAGAQLELGLGEREGHALAEAARRAGPGADPSALPFYRTCLAALELGRWTLARDSAGPGPERGRRLREVARWRRLLGREIASLARDGRAAQLRATTAPAVEATPARDP